MMPDVSGDIVVWMGSHNGNWGIYGTNLSPGAMYVDDSAPSGGNGTSWDDAFNELYDALDAANYGDEIVVGQGTYKPDTAGLSDPRDSSFQMKNNVTIAGGYAGYGATDPDERDVDVYKTIVSGDLLGNDDSATPLEDLVEDPTRTDNCYHIFYNATGSDLNETAILEGFTVTSGNADGNSSAERSNVGGGMLNRDSSPTVINCTFIRNSADGQYGGSGAGMANMYSSTTVTDCKFISNIATGVGGGLYEAESKATITGCTFSGNSAGGGGGMCNADADNDSVPTLSNCTFVGNSSGEGAGMYNTEGGHAIVSNCTFSDNDGCGMYSDEGGSAEVIDCTFSDNNGPGIFNNDSGVRVSGSVFIRNSGGRYGGGIANYSCSASITRCSFIDNTAENFGGGIGNYESSPTISYCTFIGNSAPSGGGVWNYEWDSKPKLTNCIFIGNSATYGGGGMCNAKYSIPTVTNCTFSANTAGYEGAIVNSYLNSAILTNCILWGNKAVTGGSQIALIYYSSMNVEHCDIQYGQDGVFIDDKPTPMNWGNGNIDVDPMFVDAENPRLQMGSPCIDVGDNDVVTEAADLDGNVRIFNGIVDMGAYEFAPNANIAPATVKAGAIDILENAKAGGRIDRELEKAIKHIKKSLEKTFKGPGRHGKEQNVWIDDWHLDPKHGKKVFDEEKKAAKILMDLIERKDKKGRGRRGRGRKGDKDVPEEVKDACRAAIDKLIEADDMLASIAYDEALVGEGDPKVDKELKKCEGEFEKAEKELDKDKYDKAIDHYKHAWEHAQNCF